MTVALAPAVSPDAYSWRWRAACRGADLREFFPNCRPGRNLHMAIAQHAAVTYCESCPVIDRCHEMAEHTRSEGVLAGSWRPFYGRPIPLIAAAERLVARSYR